MANQCSFCEMRHIETNMMVLGSGADSLWVEFCHDCGDRHVLTNEKGENWLVREVWESINYGAGYHRNPMDILLANDLARAAKEREDDDRAYDDYANLLAEAQANPWAVSV